MKKVALLEKNKPFLIQKEMAVRKSVKPLIKLE